MNQRVDKLTRSCPYTRVDWLENVGWSQVFLPIYPAAGDVVEIESELCFTSLAERQAELTNADPRLHWGVYDEKSFYSGIGFHYSTSTGAADKEWHVFRIVSYGPDAGFWLDGEQTYAATPAEEAYAPTGFQLWRSLSSERRCLNRKRWLRISINGKVVMHLLPVLDDNGTPALYDTVTQQLFYNTGEDELVAGPLLDSFRFRRVEYLEGQGEQFCYIPVAVDGSGAEPFVCVTDIQFLGNSRQLMGFSTNACCYWGVSADTSAYELGGTCLLPESVVSRHSVIYTRWQNAATIECNGQRVTRTTADTPVQFPEYGVLYPATLHVVTDVCRARVYGVTIYENGILTYILVPSLDSVGVACFYDEISGIAYYSQGESDFVAGPALRS
ncbi:MAG: hypothetical protein J6J97_09770 [Akkermansia sp.]|nr:hypothetical protein [Akkermansia sp.]MBQ8376362.1 hypothetical protein [Akkermansia sp.]